MRRHNIVVIKNERGLVFGRLEEAIEKVAFWRSLDILRGLDEEDKLNQACDEAVYYAMRDLAAELGIVMDAISEQHATYRGDLKARMIIDGYTSY